jgi:hypothetical protein
MKSRATRRQMMSRAITAATAGSALAWAAEASAAASPASSGAQRLARALQIEHLVVTAYRHVLKTNVLTAGVRDQLGVMLGHELEHVASLTAALERIGATVPAPPPTVQAAQNELTRYKVYWSLTRLRHQRSALKLLIDVESLAEDAYFKAIEKLQDVTLLRASAEIMACEAQHWTALSGLLHHYDVTKAIPYPFVGGAAL